MPLSPGDRLGPCEILAPSAPGAWTKSIRRATPDSIRTVATKVSTFNARFTQEAEVIAALNHPHICTLFDVGENYLVMEYIAFANDQ
jgi:serine/threonine protein kinase